MALPPVREPIQIPEPAVPEPIQIPEPHIPEPIQIPELHVPEHMHIPKQHVPEPPVQIPEPPVPEPVQIPELDTLEPTLTDAASLDQLMSFVFGEELAPPSHTRESQLLHTVPSIFDGNNDLISFLDEFERELGIEPMDLRMPKLNHCVKNSIGFKVIQPMDLSCS
ncbi:hypothetical protein TNCV_1489201 [Trichonephila clavipes]|nr:hypothetical protein TNCV_1489201 [Trichonephila clavipes]